MAIEISVNRDRPQPPFGLSLSKRPCAHSDMPFDKLRANGAKGMCIEHNANPTTVRPEPVEGLFCADLRANGDFVTRNGKLGSWLAASTLLLLPSRALAATEPAGSLLTVLLSLALILGGFVAVAWFVRRYLPGMGAQGAVKVVGTTAVGARERVVVVEIDGTWLLLGVGGGNVRLLHTLPKPESAQEHGR